MATKLDLFMAEVKAYDYKWFDEIGGNEALQEIGKLREQASGLTKRPPDACPVCFGDQYLLHNDCLMHPCPACNGTGKRR